MPVGIGALLLIIALIFFLLAGVGLGWRKINLIALGLFFWVLSILVGGR